MSREVQPSPLDDSPATFKLLQSLKALGVRIVLDDFGTGFSSLSYLRRFPFDKLKIDRSLVKEITSDSGSQVIVQSIITMASCLGMMTTAEGVETEEQQMMLRLTGCTELQGYLFSQPRPREEFEQHLAIHNSNARQVA